MAIEGLISQALGGAAYPALKEAIQGAGLPGGNKILGPVGHERLLAYG